MPRHVFRDLGVTTDMDLLEYVFTEPTLSWAFYGLVVFWRGLSGFWFQRLSKQASQNHLHVYQIRPHAWHSHLTTWHTHSIENFQEAHL